ncbi:Isopenicillin N synthase-like, Fe(2+) 2OG dioxygenase domain [Dillenia turbinata]|uniref:gibberellin 2beta-dioxygenase n=1 Tax=Dillenia turbinata TaxID=194707 RepID=A0AAN8VC11_9MAGN
MVVLSQPSLDQLSLIKTCKPSTNFSTSIPLIDLSKPDAAKLVVKACQDFGFFKVINHGVSMELVKKLEGEAVKFFGLSQSEKNKVGPAKPFGYGSKAIGPNGDMGWIEFILLSIDPKLVAQKSFYISKENPENFRSLVTDYLEAVRKLSFEILELIADGLEIKPRNVLRRLLEDEESDSVFRLNHYPPFPELQALSGENLVGFGEHTDPQIISVGRSNTTSGLQISLQDGTWVSVPPDHLSFFINVGDSLQVMTNGRFKSVKHRVFADGTKSRYSMIYFGGPPLKSKINVLPSLMKAGEQRLYKEFTWEEYKKSAYKSRLGDNRLSLFEANAIGGR